MSGTWEQVTAIVGVAVGALLSFMLTSIADQTRWRRDAAVRWYPQRMTVYAEYAFAVRQMHQVVLAGATQHRHGRRPARQVSPDVDAALTRVEAERAVKFEAVLLIGDARTVAAARRWHQALWHLECFVRGQFTGDIEWAAAMREFGEARVAYYRAARQDLGIAGNLPRTSTPAWEAELAQRGAQPVGPVVGGVARAHAPLTDDDHRGDAD